MKRIKVLVVLWLFTAIPCLAQSAWENLAKYPSAMDLDLGELSLKSRQFNIGILKSSQTLSSLKLIGDNDFDYSPAKYLKIRSANGFYHLGDLNIRLRTENTQEWQFYSSASKRAAVSSLPHGKNVLAKANLANTFPSAFPLSVERSWELDHGDLVLRFVIANQTTKNIEIGSIGFPMIFNNILEGETLDEAHAKNVFYDPYIGMDAGYLQVAKLKGRSPVLLVLPYGNTPFEAYNPLLNDPTPRGITFEGFYEWMPLTAAYAQTDWKNATPWNLPSAKVLKPNEKLSYGFKLVVAPTIQEVEQTLKKYNRPVATGIPGYVIPKGTVAKLFLDYHQPVQKIEVVPSNALELKTDRTLQNGKKVYLVEGRQWGRARLTVTYRDGLQQTIQYNVIKSESELVKDFGHFLLTKQWFADTTDVFGRAPSVISYDYEAKQQVTQDNRAWIAGLSDEGGAGSWLGAMMKQLVLPDQQEIEKLETFVNRTIWGKLQLAEPDSLKYGVRKSLFYYEPGKFPDGTYSKTINYKVWSAWPLQEAHAVGRSYNYPHVAAAYWVLYRLARYRNGLVNQKKWDWYLKQAYETSMAMVKLAPYYAQYGQMEGSVFLYLLQDLEQEHLSPEATALAAAMKKRADHWSRLNYPFGSEMPWDSTGQEEVYLWSDHFGYDEKAKVTLDAILAYMPTVPHWGYNGSARRYWDFLYGGKLSRVERQLHHYGSGLNAIPVLAAYRKDPSDLYLLRVGYGGLLGAVANITADGFGAAAFHAFPSTLKIDALSGDYGSNFYGYAVNTSTYMVNDKTYGWLAFGGNLAQQNNLLTVTLTTAAKNKLFIAPVGLWLTLDAGEFKSVSYNMQTQEVEIVLNPADDFTKNAYLRLETSKGSPNYRLKSKYGQFNGAFQIPLKKQVTKIALQRDRP